jgi:hypothetical protein
MRRRPKTKHRAPRRRTAARGGLRSAVTTVWAILAIPVALTLLCAVAEVAHLWLARLELQTGLESAALAGVKRWADESTTNNHATPGDFVFTHRARITAQAAAAGNYISGQPLVLNLNEMDDGDDQTGFDNLSCDGDIILGGFPVTGSTEFFATAAVGCGRTTTTAIDIEIEFYIQVSTPMGADTSNTDNAFRISYDVVSISAPFMASQVSLRQVQIFLRNGGAGAGVFDPDLTGPFTWTGTETPGSGPTTNTAAIAPPPFNPNIPVHTPVPSGFVTYSFSDYDPVSLSGNRPTRMTIDITPGEWDELETLVFGVDTDGVRADGNGGAVTITDQGGYFGFPGGAGNPAEEVDFLFSFDIDTFGVTPLTSLNSGLQATMGNRVANLQGHSQNNHFEITVAVPDVDFAVLTQKTVPVTPLCTQLFGVSLGGLPNVSGRAIATARCVGGNSFLVQNPQAVHFTAVNCP